VTSKQLIDQLFEEGHGPRAIFFATTAMMKRSPFPDGYISQELDLQSQCKSICSQDMLDGLIAGGVVIIRKLDGHPRARFELISRRKKTGLSGDQVARLENFFHIAPDDVMLWRMSPNTSGGELVYAGVAIYGEPNIPSRSPNYEPPRLKAKTKVSRFGIPRKLQRGRGRW
jgi:hypothetical protein